MTEKDFSGSKNAENTSINTAESAEDRATELLNEFQKLKGSEPLTKEEIVLYLGGAYNKACSALEGWASKEAGRFDHLKYTPYNILNFMN